MIFRVCDHYNDNQYNYSHEVCFICYDFISDNENTTIRLKFQNIYTKVCCCDGWIHNNCLNLWYKKCKKCPICRINIQETHNIKKDQLNINLYSYFIHIFIRKSFYKMFKIIIYCLFVFFIAEFYLSIMVTKNTIKNN